MPDGRQHLQHGPIDLIIEAWGEADAVAEAYHRAARRFETVLTELVAELPLLRGLDAAPTGVMARRMARAVAPFRPAFITPMAAVAGSVAEEILAALVGPGIVKAYVNNGGDIAVHLGPGQRLTCAMIEGQGALTLSDRDAARGIASSGWGGRSWSFGIADAVTVVARTAAMADAAATMIANAVDLPGHPAVTRCPANTLQADTDLGDRLVTTAVGPLSGADIARALDAGLGTADAFRARGLIDAAALFLHSACRVTGPLFPGPPFPAADFLPAPEPAHV
ncbi:UPF0280 family protein [Tabrizicola sp.]|uniref:UPF0280 family protein n=1 Tax=Tabrizicola sp. TaxID=2005166 RepID=UPI0027336ECB|nr:UPF0280 family protein [Tabrizicola sp.]MDP3649464.1 UPF0280 family protein [Paracoccaceae bacterium]